MSNDPGTVLFPGPVSANVLVGWHAAVGFKPSVTVTDEIHVLVLLAASLAVSVTVTGVPIFVQDTVGLVVNVRPPDPQLSVELLFNKEPGIVFAPAAERANDLVGWHAAVGFAPSRIVTVEVQVFELPPKSLTVNVATTGVPILLQLTAAFATEKVKLP